MTPSSENPASSDPSPLACTTTVSQNLEWLSVLNLTSLVSFPFALQAAIKLDMFEILSKHGKLSAQKITELIPFPISNPRAPLFLDRILLLLSSATPALPHPPLAASVTIDPASHAPINEYSLLPSSKYFLKDDNGVSLGAWWAHRLFEKLDTLKYLDVVIREGGDGFQRAYGHKVSQHVAEHSGRSDMQLHMASMTELFMVPFLEVYDGFKDVGSVVDVGGSTGSALKLILDKHPHLMGINLDQPHIVAAGVTHPRLKHVGGNMLESIPSADAVFMKAILHDWEDNECLKVFANCQKAFTSEHGKVIVADFYVASSRDGVPVVHQWDVMMLTSHGGKFRTIDEYKKLGEAAGFTDVHVACIVNELVVLEYCM